MDPKILPQTVVEENEQLKFTLSGVNVSIANALRRIILSEIDTVVFKAYNEEVNTCKVEKNTSQFNNEIVKQRLGCIPIHIDDLNMPLDNYIMELDEENDSDTIRLVTTKDFKIKNITTETYLSENDKQNIFPPYEQTGYYIDFIRLKPKLSDDIPGEAIKLSCKFSIGTSRENGMFNVVSCCSYGNTPDDVKQEIELNKLKKTWKDDGMKPDEIKFEAENWRLLDGKRITKTDSFDFTIESVGVFTNQEIVHKGCDVLIKKLLEVDTMIDEDKLEIIESNTTMKNCYDVIIKNEDYTIGKAIEYVLYTKFYEKDNLLSFCGFKKVHPHDDDSIIRVAYNEVIDKMSIQGHLKTCIQDLIEIYNKIKKSI
jgi:DNA-directed RNA polymerase alpha subunit